MSFLDKNGLQVLTTKLVQGDAIKVASHRGHTVKNVIDNITRECENIATPNTMTLENRVSEFKVGKGRDVDVSGDVEEGKVEVELKGKTYQNLIKENQSYTKDLVITNHTGFLFPKYDLKSNVTYTIMFSVSNLVKDGNDRVYCMFRGNNDSNVFIQFDAFYVEKNGVFAQKFTLANGLKNFLIGISASANKNNPTFTIGNIMILEGDHTQTPIEELPKYFENIKSSFEDGVVDVEVQGKNLFNGQLNQWSGHASVVADNLYQVGGDSAWKGGKFLIDKPLEVGKKYTISFDIENVQGNNVNFIFYEIKPYKVFSANIKHFTFTFTCEECEKPSFVICSHNGEGMINVSNIQITKTPHELPYEPYYKKKISFNIEESLRSLPNGVCDEIRNNNGQWELVRRVGKVILNGSEVGWANWSVANGGGYYLYVDGTNGSKRLNVKACSPICDTLKVVPSIYATRNKGIAITTGSYISVGFEENIVPPENLSAMKRWFADNPTTIYYELETPIITPIEPIEFDVKPLATMTINSDIAPISNHKVVLNRAEQIEQGIVQIAELKKRVDSLETAYDSYLLETQHKLSLLGFEYQLESEEI